MGGALTSLSTTRDTVVGATAEDSMANTGGKADRADRVARGGVFSSPPAGGGSDRQGLGAGEPCSRLEKYASSAAVHVWSSLSQGILALRHAGKDKVACLPECCSCSVSILVLERLAVSLVSLISVARVNRCRMLWLAWWFAEDWCINVGQHCLHKQAWSLEH